MRGRRDFLQAAISGAALAAFPFGATHSQSQPLLNGRLRAGLRDFVDPNRTLFFKDGIFRTYDWATDQLSDTGTNPNFLLHLPSELHGGFDAVLDGYGSTYSPYAYFFKGPNCCVYHRAGKRPDHPPAPYASRWNLPVHFSSDLDGAVNGKGPFAGKAYFFKGDRYARYDWATNQVDFVALLGAFDLPASFRSGIDAVVNGAGPYEGKAFFFKGDQYVRYDWQAGRLDAGYPKPIAVNWPALLGLNASPRRRFLLYVTLDPANHRNVSNGNPGLHASNLTGLNERVSYWNGEVQIADFWCPEISDSLLSDPHVLALFLSGSFTEWVEYFRNSSWRDQLDTYCDRIMGTQVPILAVCGSHQLVAYAYGGWQAVGHMSANGTPPISIAQEGVQGRFLAPNQRIGENGVFSYEKAVADPLLDNLPDTLYFPESHRDQALYPPPGATSLLRHKGLSGVQQDMSNRSLGYISRAPGEPPEQFFHAPVLEDRDRCRVQALRYRFPGSNKVLYTTQFHPDLTPADQTARQHSRVLIGNFLSIARSFWQG